MTTTSPHPPVPVHFLGISQIMAYGFLFYAFALLRDPLASHLDIAPNIVLAAVSGSLLIQAVLSIYAGKWTDQFGGLRVMASGFFIGAIGIASLTLASNLVMMCASFALIGIAIALCTYEIAFSTVVQIAEKRSRWLISVVSFYGAIASSVAWLSLQPLLTHFGFVTACLFAASMLLIMTVLAVFYARKNNPVSQARKALVPFTFSALQSVQKKALIILAAASGIEYFFFSAVALFWITWFTALFQDMTIAVWLAAIYGPFQAVGRLLEMRLAPYLDARITGLLAAFLTPITLYLAQFDDVTIAIITMMLFGIGHGILTVTFGFVTNLYFSADVYGRAKGIIAAPRAVGMAIGPLAAGLLYASAAEHFMTVFMGVSVLVVLLLASLLRLAPTNQVHHN